MRQKPTSSHSRGNLAFGGTKLSGNAREGLHETLLDITEQKTPLLNDVFSAA